MNLEVVMRASAFICVLAGAGLTLAGCGGDRPKTTNSCAGDTECSVGLCYEGQCYTSCAESADPCAAGSMCVSKPRDDGAHAVCVQAETVTCTQHSDCEVAFQPGCRFPRCDPDLHACVLAEEPDSLFCEFSADLPVPVVAATGGSMITGACFHGDCHRECVEDAGCPEGEKCVLQMNPSADARKYCAVESGLACHADGFEGEFADYCSSIFAKPELKTCQYLFVPADGNPTTTGCDDTDPVCITEGCSTACQTSADCADGRKCVAFVKPSDPEDGWLDPVLYKACR